MEKIYRVCDNPYDDRTISTPHLADFGADAWPKLERDFPAESAEVKRCTEAVTEGRSKVQQAGTERATDTDAVDDFLDEVALFMRKSQARISVDLGEDSPEFKAVYPNGRRTYSQLTKTDAPAVLLALKETIEATGDRLHAPTRERLTGFHAQWQALRVNQQSTEGELGTHRGRRNEARKQLEDALYEALLQVARKNKRNPEASRRYFDHTLLDPTYTPSLRKKELPTT